LNRLSPKGLRTSLLAIFVLSGFAGLIYQSIWSHYLGLFLGHAAYAQALVLAIFMGGMAIGAAWIAHAGQQWRNLIRGYAIIEAVIGVLGLLFHYLFTGVASFSYEALIPSLSSPWAIDLVRWFIAAAMILPQTIMLGMTFPLMSGGLIRRFSGSDGDTLGGLYFTNSIGAALGALVAVFVLLPWVGLPGAMVVAGVLNFVVAALAWWLAREPEPVPQQPSHTTPVHQSLRHNPLLRVVLVGTALSGAASFVYEIVWIRMLSMAVGSTMHAFELMLASFIAGIAFGGLWIRKRADRTANPLRLVGWMQICMGIAALMSLAVYANAFSWVGWLIQSLAPTEGGYVLFNLGTASIAIAIMLPAAFFAGTTLPLFTVTLLRAGLGERAIGRIYAWNTLGAIAGVFVAIHVLIPTLGLKLTLCAAAFLDLLIGLVLLRREVESPRAMRGFGLGFALASLALVVALRIPFDPLLLASGVFRHGNPSLSKESTVLYMRDGKTASVSVTALPSGIVAIATNGKPDAGVMMREGSPPATDEPTMAMLGSLPLALHAQPERVGVIGFGSGLTTHTILGDARVGRVDTVEIESAMVAGAHAFGTRVERAYNDPRSNIVIDDAKTYFAGQKQKYDIIISEPSNPWISGVGTLFSKEFYQFIPRQMSKDGLFVQWVQLYEIDAALISSILGGLTPAFNDYGAWLANYADMLIIASPHGRIGQPDFSHLLKGPLRAELEHVGLASEEQIAFRKVADGRVLRGLARLHGTKPVNSDYLPVLGLEAPKTRFTKDQATDLPDLAHLGPPLLEALGVRKPLNKVAPSAHSPFPPETASRLARAMAADLRGESVAEWTPGLGAQPLSATILLKNLASTLCSNKPSDQQQHLEFAAGLRQMADRTITFLPSTMLEGVWIQPKWLPCKNLPEGYAAVLGLLESLSQRDYAAMQKRAVAWLENPPANPALRHEFDQVALSHLLLAYAHQGRWKELAEVESHYGANVRSQGIYQKQRMLLLAMAHE